MMLMRSLSARAAFLAAALAAAAAITAAESPQSILAGIDAKDAKALLEAGGKLEAGGQASWALQCYRRILRLGDAPERPEAAFRAGRILLSRKDHEEAYALLREAAEKQGHAGAKALLEKAETPETRRQMDLLRAARKSMESGRHAKARGEYEQAYKLYPEKSTGAPFAPRKEVLLEMARCVDLIDDAHYQEEVKPIEGSIKDCKKCKKTGGFVECDRCKGKGSVPEEKRLGARMISVDTPCPSWVFCPSCYGLQAYSESDKVAGKERKAILDLLGRISSPGVLKGSARGALESVDNALFAAQESVTLNYLRLLKPAYSFSRELKEAFGAAPQTEKALQKALQKAATAWKSAAKDARIRANFLLNYAIEAALYMKPFEMLRAPKRKVDFAARPSAAALAPGAVPPEILSADPDDGTSGWLAVEGVFDGYKEPGSDRTKGLLSIQGGVPHNVSFFVWLPGAAAGLQWLETGSWFPRVGGLRKNYPFDVAARAAAVPRGHKVVLAGRFLRDRLGFPRNWFEVWDIQVGLSREAEAVFLALRDPVTEIEHQGMRASDLAGFLRVFHGIEVEWGPVDANTLLDVRASGCPVGVVIDAVARALGAAWRFEKGAVVLDGSASPRGDMAPVIAKLSALGKGSVEVSRSQAQAAAPRAVKLPGAPAALEELAAKSHERMDYETALACLDKLIRAAAEGEAKWELARAWEKARLFHEMTRHTPVSGLVGAKDLFRLKIKNPAGDTYEQTVRIHARTKGSIELQPGYGARVKVSPEAVVKETGIAGDAWRAEKRRELEERLGKLDGAEPRAKVRELFLLALFAKTYGFSDQGTALLERAAASDEIAWLLSTYFPAASRDLTSAWRKATRRDAKPAPAAEPVVTEASGGSAASGVRADEPVPDAPGELLPFAKRHLGQGRAYFAQSLPGMDGARERILLARGHLEKARDALENLAATRPGDPEVARLRQDVREDLLVCVKSLGFFD
jgi:tetratricopeptide (TPR) repeat protein